MKHLLLCLVMFPLLATAQMVETGDVIHFNPQSYSTSGNVSTNPTYKTSTCGPDTVQYASAKATGYTALSINNATSGYAVSQYFNCPQPLTLTGAEFFGYKIDAVGGTSLNASVYIYAAGPDSLPTGAPLATGIVAVDTNFYNGNLSLLSKVATFAPVSVSVPYVVVVENNTANGMGFIFNDYNAGDGLQEWLCGVNIGGNWLNSYDISVGGAPLDADGLIHPLVQYDIVSSFTASDYCFSGGPTISFTNNSSPIMQDRMYSVAEFLSLASLQYTWDFGDGSAAVNAIDTFNVYSNTSMSYTVTLTDTIYGWTSTCSTDTTAVIGSDLVPDFNSVPAGGGVVNFTDASTSSTTISSWFWDFGDGNTSTMQNPNNTYAASGTYTVCLTTTNVCGTDSTCHSVTVTICSNPTASFTSSSADPSFTFTDASTTTGTVTYSWDFGDGNTSTSQNPTHTYGANGTYTVTLTITDDCGTNTSTSTVTVANACVDPVAAFTQSGSEPTFTFTNTSTTSGSTTYSWDMGDGTTYTTMDATHTYTANNTYTVTLTVTDSCGSNTTTQTVTVSTIGLNELASMFKVFPNPANEVVTVESGETISSVSIYDAAGREVISKSVDANKVEISTAALAQGQYILKAYLSDGTHNVIHLDVMH